METLTDFIFLGSKIPADRDCIHEIKMPALWKKNYDKPRQYIKKQRHYLLINVHIFKAMIFPVMFGM